MVMEKDGQDDDREQNKSQPGQNAVLGIHPYASREEQDEQPEENKGKPILPKVDRR